MDNNTYSLILTKAQQIFQSLQPYCKAIYLGGSYTQTYIKNPHDIDYICFVDNNLDRTILRGTLVLYRAKHKDLFDENDDWVQIRLTNKEEHSYGSYINKDMILLCGTPVTFTFDPINNDRAEYITILKEAVKKLNNIKRYYQLYRGLLLVTKRTYDLTEEEIENLNLLHDIDISNYDKVLELKEYIKRTIRGL